MLQARWGIEDGIVAAVLDEAREFERLTGIVVLVESELNGWRSPRLEDVVYRVVREALTNVERHASASRVRIDLRAGEGVMELVVRDDGIGFSPSQISTSSEDGHFGLLGMRRRVEMAGGVFHLISGPGYGTEIRATFPRAAKRLWRTLSGPDEE